MNTGEKIKLARKNAGLTQKELGEKLEVSQAMIGQYENGLRKPKIETLHKIAQVLNVPITDFVSNDTLQLSRDVIDLFCGAAPLRIDMKSTQINRLLVLLNEKGIDKALEQVELLTKVPEYRKSTD